MLDTEERYGDDRHTKSYPKRKLLPEFDDEAVPPKNNTARRPDKPLHNRNRAATDAADDLRELLDKKAGTARSIYGSKGHTPAWDYGYQNDHADRIPVRNQHRTQQQPMARHSTSRHRGAAHPLCFTKEVLDHEFPQGFKPVNIEAYDGTTDPGVWIEDYILHIHMARGDDLHAIKYLPLKLKGPARPWLNSLPAESIGCWEDLEAAFLDNFQGTYMRPSDDDDLSHITQQPEESARNFGPGS